MFLYLFQNGTRSEIRQTRTELMVSRLGIQSCCLVFLGLHSSGQLGSNKIAITYLTGYDATARRVYFRRCDAIQRRITPNDPVEYFSWPLHISYFTKKGRDLNLFLIFLTSAILKISTGYVRTHLVMKQIFRRQVLNKISTSMRCFVVSSLN